MPRECAACQAHKETINILKAQLSYERAASVDNMRQLLDKIPKGERYAAGYQPMPGAPLAGVSLPGIGNLDADEVAEGLLRVYDDVTGDYLDVPDLGE